MSLKRRAKAATLDTARKAGSIPGGRALAAGMLGRMRIGFEPPSPRTRYEGGAEAASCISIDFDANTPEREVANHEGTFALVELSERYGIPLTWAICGKTAEDDPSAFQRLAGSSVKPDIGVHTYSHIDVSRSTEEEVEREILRCTAVLGLPNFPRTFVFPWNREAHFDLLKRMGFRAYRSQRRVIGAPAPRNGLWNIAPVYYVDHNSLGAGGLIDRYIDVCLRFRSVFHLWLHPWSIIERGDLATMKRTTLEPVFARLAELRDEGRLAASTMGGIASWMGHEAPLAAPTPITG